MPPTAASNPDSALSDDASVNASTRRSREMRRRRKLGVRLVPIELPVELVAAMTHAGALAAGQDDPSALAVAARTIIAGALKGSSALGAPLAVADEALEVRMWISPTGRDRLSEVGLLERSSRDEPIAVAAAVLSAAAQGLAFTEPPGNRGG
jgi:hypothetical protein